MKIHTEPLRLNVSHGKFSQIRKYKVQTVAFHVGKPEKRTVLLKNAGAALELWDRQLEAAQLDKEQQDKQKIATNFQ